MTTFYDFWTSFSRPDVSEMDVHKGLRRCSRRLAQGMYVSQAPLGYMLPPGVSLTLSALRRLRAARETRVRQAPAERTCMRLFDVPHRACEGSLRGVERLAKRRVSVAVRLEHMPCGIGAPSPMAAR